MSEPEEESEIEQSRMPLMEHLIELRNRLAYSVGGLLVAFVACYAFSDKIYQVLAWPLYRVCHDCRMIITAPQEAFFTYVKVSFWAAFLLAFPIIASQIWMFVAPGLYRNERRAFLPFLAATPVLFALGGALVYFLVMPLALQFFLSFQTPGGEGVLPIEAETRVSEYLSLIMALILAFGVAFQLPVLLTLLAKVGIASSAGLAAKRRYAIVGIFAVAAVLTPPDPISQISLAVPMVLLYEISIWSARMVEKKRAQRDAAEAAETGAT
jgi:sec-independent protein translocase protein TatC